MKLSFLTLPTALTVALSAVAATQSTKEKAAEDTSITAIPEAIEIRNAYINWQYMRNNPAEYQKKAVSAQIAAYKEWRSLSQSKQEQKKLQTEIAKQMVDNYRNWNNKYRKKD